MISSALLALFDALYFQISFFRIVNGLFRMESCSYCKLKLIGEIMESKILHASEGFRLLKSVCRLKLKRAWTAFCHKWSSKLSPQGLFRANETQRSDGT